MRYLVPARKLGDAWQFRMQTPALLVGRIDPRTGIAFKATIKRGLGTSHLPTARKLRDELLGHIRGLAAQAAANPLAQLSDNMAALWRQAIAEHEAQAEGGPDDLNVRGIAMEMAEEAAERNRSNPAAAKQVARFAALAARRGVPIAEAAGSYLDDRSEDSRANVKALTIASVAGFRTALALLAEFLEKPLDEVMLVDVTADEAHRFRAEFLPERRTHRAIETRRSRRPRRGATRALRPTANGAARATG